MATKSYSKHKEYKEFKTSGNLPYSNEQFDMIKSDLLPKSKIPDATGNGHREYHYEYKEEKHPSGKYDRKDLHTVEQFSVPPKTKPGKKESSSYYYERAERELPAINQTSKAYHYEAGSTSPGYSKVKTSKATKDLSHNVEELDSLLDDLQKDQERQLYKSGYTSDTAESTSFDYRRGTPVKAPSSGYSTLKKEERLESSSWGTVSPPPVARSSEMRQEMYKEEKIGGYTSDTAESSTYDYKRGTVAKAPSSGYSTLKKEERLESSSWNTVVPPPVTRSTELRQEMYKEEKTESRIVPSQVSPALPLAVPAVICANCHPPGGTLTRSGTPMNKVTTTVKTYTYEVPADTDPTTVPIPAHTETSYMSDNRHVSTTTHVVPPSPTLGRREQYVSHVASTNVSRPAPTTTVKNYHLSSSDIRDERVLYPQPVNEIKLLPENGHGPYGPTSYKYSETTYSSHNSTERLPPAGPFPRAPSPAPPLQQPPKALDDLLADFPEARFPTSQTDGVVRQRKVEISHESSKLQEAPKPPASRNVAGPPVYYPPGHTPFQPKEGYEASAMMAGGAYASGKGMYEYESGSKSKQKTTEKKTAVPICLPMCCAMPCVIM